MESIPSNGRELRILGFCVDRGANQQIRSLVDALGVDVDLDSFATCTEALAALRRKRYDSILLGASDEARHDWESRLAQNAEIAALSRVIVSTDAFAAVWAFEIGATDFLLSPIGKRPFRRMIEKVLSEGIGATSGPADALQAVDGAREPGPDPSPVRGGAGRLVVRSGGRWVVVSPTAILRAEARRNYTRLVTRDGEILARGTLQDFECRLDSSAFYRVHRSLIVQLDQVKTIESTRSGESRVWFRDGTSAGVPRARMREFLSALGSFDEARAAAG